MRETSPQIADPNAQDGVGTTDPIGGRFGRWIGAILLIQFVIVLIIKLVSYKTGEILWMSHTGLLLAGLGLVLNRSWLVGTALTGILVPHATWLFDFTGWLLFGVFPLNATSYLTDADWQTWLGGIHHFYLLPLLIVLVVRHGRIPWVVLPVTSLLYLMLSALSRWLVPADRNVNWTHIAFPGLNLSCFEWMNRLPVLPYMILLNLLINLLIVFPGFFLVLSFLRWASPRWVRASAADSADFSPDVVKHSAEPESARS